jgi:hypothetical protein
MMQDYGRTQELVSAANNSAGASQSQYEKSLESMESKLQQLKNAWDEFTMGIMNSTFLKAGIDILTKLINLMNRTTNAFGSSEKSVLDWGKTANSVMNSFTKIGTILSIFNIAKAALTKMLKWVSEKALTVSEDAGKRFGEGIRRAGPTIKNAATEVATQASNAAVSAAAPAEGTTEGATTTGGTEGAPKKPKGKFGAAVGGFIKRRKLIAGASEMHAGRVQQKADNKQHAENIQGLVNDYDSTVNF